MYKKDKKDNKLTQRLISEIMKLDQDSGLYNEEVCAYSKRLKSLEDIGFVQKRGNITNGKYSFLYHQIDTSEMTEEQFTDFINIVKLETLNTKEK